MKQPIKKQPIKVCSCGKEYNVIPDTAKKHANTILPGWYWNCACGSTLVIPLTQLRAALMIAMTFLFVACGGSGGGSDSSAPANQLTCNTLAGQYNSDWHPGETLTINNDCTFTDSYCGYDASYTVPSTLDNGATVITVRNTNGCIGGMSSTAHMCILEFNGTQLGINCDDGAHLFLFTVQ